MVAVPAGFVGEEGPLHALKGTFTVLADGGMSDIELLRCAAPRRRPFVSVLPICSSSRMTR